MLGDNEGRSGVLIRGVTRGADQKLLPLWLKRQARFKQNLEGQLLHAKAFPVGGAVDEATIESVSEEQMMEQLHADVLAGAYHLIDYRGYAGYEPGDNVVNIFAMGSLTTEAIRASELLLERGIYGNVIVVTSPDLFCGINAHENNYDLLKNRLGIDGNLYLQPAGGLSDGELMTVAGRRIPVVSVHDGEAGLLDNIGSALGVRHECLAVRKHSKSGRPTDIYAYHHIDADSVVEAAGKVLSETALESVQLSPRLLQALGMQQQQPATRTDLEASC